eukprot:2966401-Pleurochrysis_carterae.AAC.1
MAWLKPAAGGSARSFLGSEHGGFSRRTRTHAYSHAPNQSMARRKLSHSDAMSTTFSCCTPTTDRIRYTRLLPPRSPLDGTLRTKV